ncbi:MAG: SAM-dependent methyltransferase [Candidatus Egerieousia sp.]
MEQGKLYLIPSPLGDSLIVDIAPQRNLYIINSIKHFVVEEITTARRFLSKAGLKGKIEELQFYELNEHTDPAIGSGYVKLLLEGHDVGLISEAGLPAVADPGNILVAAAHEHDIKVIPLVGPSSLMMALMASGLQGQNFTFNGYIPVKEAPRKAKIREMESLSKRLKQSQIFIETPYRNDSLLRDLLSTCNGRTMLTIAANITLPSEFIKTKSIAQWKETDIRIGKNPCVFIILA